MYDSYVIAGLGAIGTYVARLLIEQGCNEITVYDYDTLSESDLDIFPFYSHNCINKHKSLIFKQYAIVHYPNTRVNAYVDKFTCDFIPRTEFVYIDCRDKKELDFDFDLRISFDGGVLTLDSRKIEEIDDISFYSNYSYHSIKNKNLLICAASNCCEYISDKRYIKNDLRIFELTKRTAFQKR